MSFLHGLAAPFRAVAFVARHPRRLLPWLLLPVLINVTAIACAAVAAFAGTPLLVHTVLWPAPTGGFGWWVWTTLTLSLGLFLFVIAVFAVYFLASAFGSPFYDRLSAEVEMIELGDLPIGGPWSDMLWSFLHSLVGLALWVVLVLVGSLLNLLPGVGAVIEFVITLLGTAFLITREMLDGPMSRRRMGFVAKMCFVARHFGTLGGFGLAVAGMVWIPLLNFVMVPLAVVAGTRLYLELATAEEVTPSHGGSVSS